MTTRRALMQTLTALAIAPRAHATEQNPFDIDGPIDVAIGTLAREDRFSGVVAASLGGTRVYARAFGLANRERAIPNAIDTRFNLASAGKMFTTVAIGQLIDAGALGLNDRVAQYLPDLPDEVTAQITIAQLLSHTSGLGSYFASPHWAERGPTVRSVGGYLAFVREERVAPDYDGGYRYSNSGYVLLGAVIERLNDRSYYDVVRDRVFTPAGMTRSTFPLGEEAAPDLAVSYTNGCFARPLNQCAPQAWAPARPIGRGGPAGGGVSTADDLLAFVAALKAGRLITNTTLNALKTERGRLERPGGPIDAYALGFGRLTVHGRSTWGHNGGTPGAQAQIDVFEDEDLTLVVLCNQDGGQRPASAALRRMSVS